MSEFEFIEAIEAIEEQCGVRARVEIFGEVSRNAAATASYLSYHAKCRCGANEGFVDQNAAIKWAENHMDTHAD